MNASQFNVVFCGKLVNGYTREQVQHNLAALYNVPVAKLDHWFAGQPVIIKRQLDETTAQKYQNRLAQAGAICHIRPGEEMTSKPDSPPVPQQPQSMTCPKCGFEQPQDPTCMRCGIVIQRYLERQQQMNAKMEQTMKHFRDRQGHISNLQDAESFALQIIDQVTKNNNMSTDTFMREYAQMLQTGKAGTWITEARAIADECPRLAEFVPAVQEKIKGKQLADLEPETVLFLLLYAGIQFANQDMKPQDDQPGEKNHESEDIAPFEPTSLYPKLSLTKWGDPVLAVVDRAFKKAQQYGYAGVYQQAIACFEDCFELVSQHESALFVDQYLNILVHLAYCYADMLNFSKALEIYAHREQILTQAPEWYAQLPKGLKIIMKEAYGQEELLAQCYQDMAIAYYHVGNVDTAKEYFARSSRLFLKIDIPEGAEKNTSLLRELSRLSQQDDIQDDIQDNIQASIPQAPQQVSEQTTQIVPSRGEQIPQMPPQVAQEPPLSAQPESMICPKCGFEQPYAQTCMRCGIVTSRYVEQQAEYAERRSRLEHAPNPIFFNAVASSAWKSSRVYRVYILPDELIFIYLAKWDGVSSKALGVESIPTPAVGGGLIGTLLTQAAVGVLSHRGMNKISQRMRQLKGGNLEEVLRDHKYNFRASPDELSNVSLDPRSAWSGATEQLIHAGVFRFTHQTQGKMVLLLPTDEDMAAAFEYIPVVLKNRLKIAPEVQERFSEQIQCRPIPEPEQQPQATQTAPVQPTPGLTVPIQEGWPSITTIQKRIRVLQDIEAAPKYQIGIITPLESQKVRPVPGGISLGRLTGPPIMFHQIYAMCVFLAPLMPTRTVPDRRIKMNDRERIKRENVLVVDIFLGGKIRPYRILSHQVEYPKFLPDVTEDEVANFHLFLLWMVSQIVSIYLDQETVDFLCTRVARTFPNQLDIACYEKKFWGQLMNDLRFQCQPCGEVYWFDGNTVPEGNAYITCLECQHPVRIGKEHSAPLDPALLQTSTDISSSQPDEAETCFTRGNAYFERGQVEQALAEYTKSLSFDPRHVRAYCARGLVYYALGQHQRAIADYTQAITLDPDQVSPADYCNRGVAYKRLGQYEQAIADYTTAITLDPEDATAYNNRGVAYKQIQQYEQAIADYTTAITLDPEYADAYGNCGFACAESGQFQQAIAMFQRFIELIPLDETQKIEIAQQWISQLRKRMKEK